MSPAPDAQNQVAPRIATGTLDAELGALLWLLVEARVPLVVAGPPSTDRRGLRDALAAFRPSDTTTVILGGEREDFAWMPEAIELGWRARRWTRVGSIAGDGPTVLVTNFEDGPGGTWGERARIAVRALSVGYGMLATSPGSRLEDVFDGLGQSRSRRARTSWRGSASS